MQSTRGRPRLEEGRSRQLLLPYGRHTCDGHSDTGKRGVRRLEGQRLAHVGLAAVVVDLNLNEATGRAGCGTGPIGFVRNAGGRNLHIGKYQRNVPVVHHDQAARTGTGIAEVGVVPQVQAVFGEVKAGSSRGSRGAHQGADPVQKLGIVHVGISVVLEGVNPVVAVAVQTVRLKTSVPRIEGRLLGQVEVAVVPITRHKVEHGAGAIAFVSIPRFKDPVQTLTAALRPGRRSRDHAKGIVTPLRVGNFVTGKQVVDVAHHGGRTAEEALGEGVFAVKIVRCGACTRVEGGCSACIDAFDDTTVVVQGGVHIVARHIVRKRTCVAPQKGRQGSTQWPFC